MKLEDRLKGYLGLAARAGRVQSGEEASVKAAQTGKARRLFLEDGAGENTRDRMQRLSEHYGIELTVISGLGEAIGKRGRKAAALTDEGLNRAIQQVINEYRGGVNEE